MNWKINIRLICLELLLILSFNFNGIAQNTSFELWPETDLWYRIDPSWRLSSFIAITKYFESESRDLNISVQAEYAWGQTKYSVFRKLMNDAKAQVMKAFLIRVGFMEGTSLGNNAGDYTEDMPFAEIHKREPLVLFIGEILLSQRFRADFRWVGEDPEFSYRLRYRAMIEEEFKDGDFSVIPYLNAELYWDSRYSTINRVRTAGGATLSWSEYLAFEGNVTYQHDSKYTTQNLYALNLILHVFFE